MEKSEICNFWFMETLYQHILSLQNPKQGQFQ